MEKGYSKVWLWFLYFWIICGIGVFVGQFIPPSIRTILSVILIVVILGSLLFKGNRKWNTFIMHFYSFAVGIIAYGSFAYFLNDLGVTLFIKTVLMAIGAFIAFGLVGYFLINDASSIGKYLFVTLIALLIASLIGIFVHNTIFITILTVVGLLLFLLYTLYDFNRLKRGQFEPMEMGFNLFMNLLNIILDLLRLVSIFRN